MKRVLALMVLFGILSSIPAAGTPTQVHQDIVLSSNTIVKQFHQQSRNSAVKVVNQRGHGSGTYVKIGKNFFVLTARHVVNDTNIVVIQGGIETVIGEIVFKSESQDIALVKIPALRYKKPIKVKPTSYNNLEIGDELVYSGFPSSYELLTSGAQVSGTDSKKVILQGFAWPGSSGCGAIDSTGKVIGIIVGVGIDWVRENPQLIETIVWMEPITTETWEEIIKALRL
jgi:S1-C subfamily serine protease